MSTAFTRQWCRCAVAQHRRQPPEGLMPSTQVWLNVSNRPEHARKHDHIKRKPHWMGALAHAGGSSPCGRLQSTLLPALSRAHTWMPNQPHATRARRIDGRLAPCERAPPHHGLLAIHPSIHLSYVPRLPPCRSALPSRTNALPLVPRCCRCHCCSR